jgi:hypothetical protein
VKVPVATMLPFHPDGQRRRGSKGKSSRLSAQKMAGLSVGASPGPGGSHFPERSAGEHEQEVISLPGCKDAANTSGHTELRSLYQSLNGFLNGLPVVEIDRPGGSWHMACDCRWDVLAGFCAASSNRGPDALARRGGGAFCWSKTTNSSGKNREGEET